jgi:hypothetical protein
MSRQAAGAHAIVTGARAGAPLVLGALLGLLGLSAACSRSPAPPTSPAAPAPSTDAAPAADPAAAEPAALTSAAVALPEDPLKHVVFGRCTICHDERYLAEQRLTAEQWQKTVVKMQGFGAPVPDADAAGIASYLARSFPAASPDRPPPLVEKPASGLPWPSP